MLTTVLLMLGILQVAAASPSPKNGQTILTAQAGSTLSFVEDAPPMTFIFMATQPRDDNWIGVWKADDTGAPSSNDLAWAFAAGSRGKVHIQPPASMASGKYKAYLIGEGNPRVSLAGPVEVTYCDGGQKPCNGRCIPLGDLCCPSGQKECNGSCIDKERVCCPSSQKDCHGSCIDKERVCCPSSQKDCHGSCIDNAMMCCPSNLKECHGSCIDKERVCCPSSQKDCHGSCIDNARVCCPSSQKDWGGSCVPSQAKTCSGKLMNKPKICWICGVGHTKHFTVCSHRGQIPVCGIPGSRGGRTQSDHYWSC
ncbi:hypothetical protein OCS_00648 [Ophiocordyceps sinensis CO18]|uniref:Uncharacterized protein n=1 Tax=Ophiocordyceps sinensis (strain Co18 / CGMCC 3.14243) TaxID=911162 RepID=T5AM46_OPHSC|nr:hypothetical protein OCS_00648 [Ophiocordyceps sinensis CO18]